MFGLASLRFAKFLLKEWIIVLTFLLSESLRAHCPIHGPHAFAKTSPPIFLNISRNPSLSVIDRICSEPGVIVNSDFATSLLDKASFTTDAALERSSYDEFVHEPISPTSTSTGQLFLTASSFIREMGVARSGVKGPLI